jgi:hypothetical protein
MRWVGKPSPALIVAVIALVAAVGGFAVAAVPDEQGRITSCYAKKSGKLRVLVRGTACRRSEKRLRWNQAGPAGPAGAAGAAGAVGPAGATGSPAASMLTANTLNAASANETRYIHPSGTSDLYLDVDLADMLSPSTPVVARDLAAELPNPPGAGESYVITFNVNDTDTALTCTIQDPQTTCSNSAAQVNVPAGSTIAFEVQTSTAAVSRRVRLGWRATQS